MKTSPHISFEKLANLAADGNVSNERNETLQIEITAHLSICMECTSKLQSLTKVMSLMKSDREPSAPRDVVAYAVNLFDRGSETKGPSTLRRLVAALTFDSHMNVAPAFGVRSGQAASRQLLYSAETHEVDVRITSQDDQWTVAGQLLGEACEGGEVTLVNLDSEDRAATGVLNELCEFSLPSVAPGSYRVVLRLSTLEVEIPQIELGA